MVTGLKPNCRYRFRIRAINGFGAGPYVFRTFMTTPEAPSAPVAVKVGCKSITLSWRFRDNSDAKRINDMMEIFNDLDKAESGSVVRDEFMETLERRRPKLIAFLHRTTAHTKNRKDATMSVYDTVESNDAEMLSWRAFSSYFKVNSQTDITPDRQTSAAKYVLKSCVDEAQALYEEIYKGGNTSFTIHNLKPSTSYQFRVQAVNDDDMPSLHSEATVVNTLLSKPPAPFVQDLIGSTSVRLKWLPSDKVFQNSKSSVNQMLEEWAKGESPRGSKREKHLDLEAKFHLYDYHHSSKIDLPELKTLLEDLGVVPTKERMSSFLDQYDVDGKGIVRFSDFSLWWYENAISYAVSRNEGVLHDSYTVSQDNAPTPLLCYHGDETSVLVKHLEPNTSYQFRLRHYSVQSSSSYSDSVRITTAPNSPSAIGVVSIGKSTLQLRWYSSPGSARACIQCRFIEMDDDEDPPRDAFLQLEWETVYEGTTNHCQIENLAPSAVYAFRAYSYNVSNICSEPSPVLEVTTNNTHDYTPLIPANAPLHFSIECSDAVLGDTILFTERILDTRQKSSYIDTHASTSSLLSTTSNRTVLGERTIAGRILSFQDKRNQRCATLSVLWCTVDLFEKRKTHSNHTIPTGSTLQRQLKSLFRYEAYRIRWIDESCRTRTKWLA